jgi:hypothetical protein
MKRKKRHVVRLCRLAVARHLRWLVGFPVGQTITMMIKSMEVGYINADGYCTNWPVNLAIVDLDEEL